MKWNTQEIKDLIQTILQQRYHENALVPQTITVREPCGDYDTEEVVVQLYGIRDRLLIKGFRTEDYFKDGQSHSEAEVEHIQLRDTSADSKGGVQTHYEDLAVLGILIATRLRKRGWSVIPNLNDYF